LLKRAAAVRQLIFAIQPSPRYCILSSCREWNLHRKILYARRMTFTKSK